MIAVVAGLVVWGTKPVSSVKDLAAAPLAAVLGGGSDELVVLSHGTVIAWDPQRIVTRETAGFANRVFLRTLTAYAPEDGDEEPQLVGDLAQGTGKPNDDLTAWSFTLRDGVRWQDGSPVTCEDVAYGVSRSFAKKISGGATYALAYLDIPKQSDGSTTYAGPYADGKGAEKGQKAFDKAVTCDGRTITFHLSEPVAEFSGMVSLAAFAPYKKSEDEGKASLHAVFSTGPYKLKDPWVPGEGGTFVRNKEWDPETDPFRQANPDRIVYREGRPVQDLAERIMTGEGDGARAVSIDPVPPALHDHLAEVGDLEARSMAPRSPLIEYLAPNVESDVFAKKDARLALALATDRAGYVEALGGERAASSTYSLLCPTISGREHDDVLGAGPHGDPDKARRLLEESGFDLPVSIDLAYRSAPLTDKAVKVLVEGWEDAGFRVETHPIAQDYFSTIAEEKAAKRYDVFWANWAADWPSASTVLPPLFDSRVNLTKEGPGRDYGRVDDEKLNEMMSKADGIADDGKRQKAWREVDTRLLERGYYIPLAQRRSLIIAGSDVTGLTATEVYGGTVDLAVIGVD